MAVTIKKLTPPQVAAVLKAFPVNTEAGLLTSTASQVTFRDIPGKEPWRVCHVRKALTYAITPQGSVPRDRRDVVAKVIEKLDTRPDLVVES